MTIPRLSRYVTSRFPLGPAILVFAAACLSPATSPAPSAPAVTSTNARPLVSASPSVLVLKVAYANDLSGPRSDFEPFRPPVRSTYANGGLEVDVADLDNAQVLTLPIASGPSDQRVAADVVFVRRGAGSSVGLVCRWALDLKKAMVGYVFVLWADGTGSILRFSASSPSAYLVTAQRPAARFEPSASNHLEADCVGAAPVRLTLRVNGEELLHFEDMKADSLDTANGAGLSVSTDREPMRALFRNLSVQELAQR